MDRSRAAYTGPPPPRNYAFKRNEEFRKRDSYRPVGERHPRPLVSYRPFRPNMGPSSSQNYRPLQSQVPFHNMSGSQHNWRPRGSFRRPLWRPRPERLERLDRNSPKKSWKKAKIVIKEKSSDDSDESRPGTPGQSSVNHVEHELGQIYDTNEESGQIYEGDSGQIDEEEAGQMLDEDSGQIDEEEAGQILQDEIQDSREEGKEYDEDSDYDQDYIEEQIDKIDNEISRLETQLASIRAKKEDEDLNECKVEVVKNSWDDLDKTTLNDEELIGKVYSDNRKIVMDIDFVDKISKEDCFLIGSDTVNSLLQKDLENHLKISQIISNYIASQKRAHLIRVTCLALEYKERNFVWKRKIDKLVTNYENRRSSDLPSQVASALPSPVLPSAPSPVTPSTQVGSSRNRRSGFRSDYVKSESELASALIALGVDPAEVELDTPKNVPQDDPSRLAVEPPMILDPSEKYIFGSFKSSIGLVKDPVKSLEDFNSSLELHWHKEEKDIFKTRLLQHGKNLRKIASYLPLKSTADCIQYFYREKINLGFKQAIRRGVNAGQRGRKKAKSSQDVDQAKTTFRIWKLNSDEELPRQRQGLLQYVSWDPTEQGKEDFPFEDEYMTPWTNEEEALALKALEEYGKDYSSISQVLGNKSEDQIRSFYANYKRKQKKQKLEEMNQIIKEMRDPGPRNLNDINQDAYDWEESERRRGKKRNIKRKEDDVVKKKPKNKVEMEAVSTNTMGNADDLSRRTISYWSVSEKAQFISSLKLHGRKWDLIANDVGTKSAVQVRNFFSNSRSKLNLDQILAENESYEIKSGDNSALDPPKRNIRILKISSGPRIWNNSQPQNFYDHQNSLSNHITLLPPPSPSKRAILLDTPLNDNSTLPPMRNILQSGKNIGLGISKIEQLLASEKNQETTVITTENLGQPTNIQDNSTDLSVISSVNRAETLYKSKHITSRKCEEEKHMVAETDKVEVQVIKIAADSKTILNTAVASNAELGMESVEKTLDTNQSLTFDDRGLDTLMDVDFSEPLIKSSVKSETVLSQSNDLKDHTQEYDQERLDPAQTLNSQIVATVLEPSEFIELDDGGALKIKTSADANDIASSSSAFAADVDSRKVYD